MIKLFVFARRLPQLTPEEFHDHWTHRHARHLADTPAIRRHIRRYELNHRPEWLGIPLEGLLQRVDQDPARPAGMAR